jgi:hypothetical protein
MQYEDDRKEKKRRDEMERQAREARAARHAAEATASRNRQQDNPDAASPVPDDDGSVSILPVHESEGVEDPVERSPSPDASAGMDNSTSAATNQPSTPPHVTVRLA